MSFVVNQEKYQGPFHLLLDLLEKKDLEITDVALAGVADDFLDYVEQSDVTNDELADFLVIASRLIYLKSKAMMPYLLFEDEEEGAVSLQENLRLYKEFAELAEEIKAILARDRFMFNRNIKVNKIEINYLPPQDLQIDQLVDSFSNLLKKLQPFFVLQKTSMERIKTVSERIAELQKAIETRAKFSFGEVVKGSRNRGDVIVSFLALLELVRRNVVRASHGKDDEKHDIIIERI